MSLSGLSGHSGVPLPASLESHKCLGVPQGLAGWLGGTKAQPRGLKVDNSKVSLCSRAALGIWLRLGGS